MDHQTADPSERGYIVGRTGKRSTGARGRRLAPAMSVPRGGVTHLGHAMVPTRRLTCLMG